MKIHLLTLCVLLCTGVAHAAEPVKLLCGFEAKDAKAWGLKPDGEHFRAKVGQYKSMSFCKVDAPQGKFALSAERGQRPITAKTRYNVLRRGAVLNAYGWFRKRLPTDWSGYDTLRLDFKSAAAAGRVRIEVEDEMCQPAVRRTYAFPAGKWVTLEFDLAEASKLHTVPLPEAEWQRWGAKEFTGRVLNPKRMANVCIYLEQMGAKSTILIDNLRLAVRTVKERLPVVRDKSPFPAPQMLPAPKPVPVKPPAAIKSAAVRDVDLSKARKTGYARVGGPTGRAVVAVGPRTLVGFLAGYVHVLQTADAGVTWTGLNNKPAPTRCYHDANAPSHCAAAAGADMLYSYTDHCAGGGSPSNMFFRTITFNGKGWTLNPIRLLDVDCRHCPEWKVRLVRLGSGRIWAAWAHLDRFGKLGPRARYSDDAGVTWRDHDSNAMMIIDRDQSQGPQRYGVTLWVEKPAGVTPPFESANGRLGAMYAHGGLELTPYGDRIACIWANTWHPKAVWSAFDGQRWTKPEQIGQGSPGSAVAVGKTIYVTLSHRKRSRLMRLDGAKWVEETLPEGRPGTLSVVDGKLVNIWTRPEEKKVGVYIMMRGKDGWTKPRRIALESPGTGPRARIGLAAPQYATGSLPIAWGPRQAWIRTIRWSPPAGK
jgi:hypothetical protein